MNIIKLNAIDSTNTYLVELAKNKDLLDDTIVVANDQKKGRGQRNMSWQSQPNKSLTFSLFKRLDGVFPQQQFVISMAVAVAVVNYLIKLTETDFNIKWPNDIMAEGKKCGGILIENQMRGNTIKTTVIGIGVNINNNHFTSLPQATSLLKVTGDTYDLDEILKEMASEILMVLNQLNVKTISEINSKYHALLFKNGVPNAYKLPDGRKITGSITGVKPSGQLEIKLPDGELLTFWNKEIEMLY